MKTVLFAVVGLVASFAVHAYNLSPQECYQGAEISGRAAAMRDKGTPKEELVAQTMARKDAYIKEDHYYIVLEIIEMVYGLPELTDEQHAQRFLDECVNTKGKMHPRV